MHVNSSSKAVFLLAAFAPSIVLFHRPLIEQLLSAGHSVAIGTRLSELSQVDKVILDKLGVHSYNINISRSSTSVIFNVRLIYEIYQALKAAKCNVLIPYTITPIIFGTFAAKLAGYRYVMPIVTGLGSMFIGEPESMSQSAVRLIVRRLYRSAFSFAEVVFFLNPDDPVDLIKVGALSSRNGLPHKTIPASKLESGRYRPASGLAGA